MSSRLVISSLALFIGTVTSGCPIRREPALARLDPAQAVAVDLIMVGGRKTYCPSGTPARVKAVVTLSDGRKLETWTSAPAREGKLGFDAFEWATSFGSVDGSGFLRVPADPFASIGREIRIAAAVAGRPKLTAEIVVRASFDCGGFAGARGRPGSRGRAGAPGPAGTPGQSGNSSRAATDGGAGGHGQDGGDGGRGEDGPRLEVALGYVDTEVHGRLVVARVGRGYYLFDPAGEHLAIAASGGAGGSGGAAGSGGNGGPGGENNIEGGGDGGDGGDGGNGGDGGDGGDGGRGGAILLRYDRRFPELPKLVSCSTPGGAAGRGGSPGFAGAAGTGGSSTSGKRGAPGRRGQPGQRGRDGRPGQSGAGVRIEAAEVGELFGAELERDLPIVPPGPARFDR